MLYFLHELTDIHSGLNIFRYITFRAAGASVTAFLLCLVLGPSLIFWLKKVNVIASQKRESAESIHKFFEHKKIVPTMGGVVIVLSVVVSILLWGNLRNEFVWLSLLMITWFTFVGFLDDAIKLSSKSSKGISSITKLVGQVLAGVGFGLYLYLSPDFSTTLSLPFLKKGMIFLGIFFIPFVVFVLVGSSNALNLTDGLDGLAIGCNLFASGAFAIITYLVGRVDFSSYLSIPYIPQAGELTIVCTAIVGASAGFLWFNSFPAEVMMGDTGSLPLGGILGTIAVLTKKELVLIIIGGVFVMEAVSVILQVASFKLFKKRIFKMAPFHHHLQLMGWPESKVTVRLWIIALIFAVIGISTLKIR